jgi:hypothetical protein
VVVDKKIRLVPFTLVIKPDTISRSLVAFSKGKLIWSTQELIPSSSQVNIKIRNLVIGTSKLYRVRNGRENSPQNSQSVGPQLLRVRIFFPKNGIGISPA